MAYKDLKITRLELLMVKPRFMFLKMHTNQDLVGYGEPILEGQTHAVAGAVRAMENYLLARILDRSSTTGRLSTRGASIGEGQF